MDKYREKFFIRKKEKLGSGSGWVSFVALLTFTTFWLDSMGSIEFDKHLVKYLLQSNLKWKKNNIKKEHTAYESTSASRPSPSRAVAEVPRS